jgi:hypothetical protein
MTCWSLTHSEALDREIPGAQSSAQLGNSKRRGRDTYKSGLDFLFDRTCTMLALSGRRLVPTEDGVERPLLVPATLGSLLCHVALNFLLELLSVELPADRVLCR